MVLSIEDDGEGPREGFELGDAGGGHGLVGMRERAALYGGHRAGGPAPRRRLRRARAAAHAAARPRRRAVDWQGAGMSIRVLLVDDQALIRAGFRMILDAEEDMEVVGECADGTQAVDSARRLKPDVVLMDIRMPEMDGIEATRLIAARERRGAAPRVLMLTTFDLDEYVYDALRAGASGFLLKDVPAEQLVDGIRVVAQGDALLAPSVTKRLIHEFSRGPRRSRARPAALEELTPRELEVFKLIARGMSNAEIAAELVVSETTVKTHVARVLMKLGVRDRVQAVVLAYESGVVAPGATSASSRASGRRASRPTRS